MPDTSAPPEPTLSRRSIVIGTIIVMATLLILLLVGSVPRRQQRLLLENRAHAVAAATTDPQVTVVRVARAANASDLLLPGTMQAYHDAAIFARSTGYVRHWYADIGQRVKAGQLLATIDAPDLDQQLSQAKANAANTRAALALAKSQVDRWAELIKDSVVTADEYDQKRTAYDAAVANTKAADDNVSRMETLVAYEHVSAPFDGVITARNVDDGSFITANGTTNTAIAGGVGGNTVLGSGGMPSELFHLARVDTMRVYVGVPQSYAPAVRSGVPAALEAAELPGQTFPGRVVRSADAVDAASRTLLTEVDVPNVHRSLLPGMYVQVHFSFVRATPPILMPSTALIFRTAGAQVAIIGNDSAAHFRTLRIGRDYGTVMEVVDGLNEGDLVINQPSDNLRDGQHVHAKVLDQEGPPSGDKPVSKPVVSKFRPPPQVIEGFPGSPQQ